eukprot:14381473-Alexandrium_andersonii.AAC.1
MILPRLRLLVKAAARAPPEQAHWQTMREISPFPGLGFEAAGAPHYSALGAWSRHLEAWRLRL